MTMDAAQKALISRWVVILALTGYAIFLLSLIIENHSEEIRVALRNWLLK